MRVLLAHNAYQQPGGEDTVFAAEAALLAARGHAVARYEAHNDAVAAMGRAELARATVWNPRTAREVRALIRRERPDVVHAHNTFPLISPALYYAARAEGVPVVQTLHNYRLACPNAQLFRDGRPCGECVGRAFALPAVAHRCYRGSRAQSLGVATLLAAHRAAGTWADAVDVYIALSDFARDRHVEGGLPAGKIVVKPNFVHPDPGAGEHRGGYALFVGRLSEEKGVDTLLRAWALVGDALPLRIVGDGPLGGRVREAAASLPGVEWLGRRGRPEVLRLMQDASVLVVPSVWYEPFGMVLVEGFSAGLPAIASASGGLAGLVAHGRTGLLFEPGAPEALAAQVRWAAAHPDAVAEMRRAARREFEARYTADVNYGLLLAAYRRAAEAPRRRGRGAA